MTREDKRIALAIFTVVFAAYAWFFGGGGWNQNVNFDLTRALVEQHTIHIDAYAANTGDVAVHAGHVYSNKPPGVSLLAAVPYAVIYAVERIGGVEPRATFPLIVNLWICTVVVCGVSGALLAAALYVYARVRVGVSAGAAASVALVVAFGTYVFAYSSVLFMHVPNALLLFLAFALVKERPAIAGACAGMAVVVNYMSLPAALLILILCATREGLVRYIAGAAPFAVVLLTYQTLAFGSPFRTSIAYENPSFLEANRVLGVLSVPDVTVIFQILFGRYRGLFYLSPVLLLAIAGAIIMVRRRILLRELAVLGGIVASFILFNGAFNGWHGGAAIGPRYILPIVPFLAIPMLFVTHALRPVWIALAAWSVFVNFAVVAVNPLPSPRIEDPVGAYIVPLFFTGHLPASTPPAPLWSWKVMLGHVSVNRTAPDEQYPYTRHPPRSPEAEWASFNLGETIARGSLWSLAPAILWMAGGAWFVAVRCRRSSSRPDRSFA